MNLDALLRAAQILRSQPSYSMPLARLHTCLAEELGADAGTYAEIYLALKKRPQSFMVLDAPQLLGAVADQNELAESSLGACVRVALTERSPKDEPADALGMATDTVSELWRRAGGDAVLRDHLARAAEELGTLTDINADSAAERPTTRPRGPRS